MYTSELYDGEIVIGQDNFQDHINEWSEFPRGRHHGTKQKYHGYYNIPYTAPFSFPIIPRNEWPDRISEMESDNTRVSDMLLAADIPSLNQEQTNYCWCNAVTGCVQALRCQQDQEYISLSPASVAAPVTGFRNEGGEGLEALQYMVQNGIASTDIWPANAIDESYVEPAAQERLLHKVTSFVVLQQGNFDQLMTMLFMRMPTAIGLDWWSHEVMACDPVSLGNGQFGIRFRNSWGASYGSNGFNTLTEQKATPDDACSPLVTIASNE